MKLKKILSAILASAVIAGTSVITAFAAGEGEAAYCFDNTSKLSDWQTYGSTAETGFKISHTNLISKNGNGCILISESSAGDIENQFGGAYISAEALGVDDFRGCTVEMSMLLCEGAEGFYDNLSLYSDGIIWLTQPAENLSTSEWTTVTMVVPENADNTKIGFTIPTFNAYTGDIVYIDDVSVTKPDGTVIANTGDYEARKVKSEDAVSTGTNIALTVLLVVLILAIIGGIGLIVSAAIRRFT